MIAIIDYDAGNIASVQKAFEYIGEQVLVTRNPNEILNADKVVLPGVGAYADCMEKLHRYELIDTIHQVAKNQTPFLGICLGMQLMFDYSEEGGHVEGLSMLSGKVTKIPEDQGLKIPHIGWNSLKINPKSRLFEQIDENAYVYFVHSYYLTATDPQVVAATTEYATKIDAAVEQGNLFGCQFHPEKSGKVGLQILRNFANL